MRILGQGMLVFFVLLGFIGNANGGMGDERKTLANNYYKSCGFLNRRTLEFEVSGCKSNCDISRSVAMCTVETPSTIYDDMAGSTSGMDDFPLDDYYFRDMMIKLGWLTKLPDYSSDPVKVINLDKAPGILIVQKRLNFIPKSRFEDFLAFQIFSSEADWKSQKIAVDSNYLTQEVSGYFDELTGESNIATSSLPVGSHWADHAYELRFTEQNYVSNAQVDLQMVPEKNPAKALDSQITMACRPLGVEQAPPLYSFPKQLKRKGKAGGFVENDDLRAVDWTFYGVKPITKCKN